MWSVELVAFPEGGTEGYPRSVGEVAWEESHLARSRPFWVWWAEQEAAMNQPHMKIIVRTPGGEPVGGMFIVEGMDAQVGHCLMAYHQFLLPEARKVPGVWRQVMRDYVQAAKLAGIPWIIWTHRDQATGKIYYRYKEVSKWEQ